MRRPLGCMTFSALFAGVLVAAAIVGSSAASGNGIFSPGALSSLAHADAIQGVASHADLEARCDACHVSVWSGDTMAGRCLVCHTQVQQEIASGGGLHGRFASTADCRGCHTDHRGADAALTLADPEAFPHERTGYVLKAHALRGNWGNFTCRDCHPGSPQAFVPVTCASCHQGLDAPFMTAHLATFGETCLNCHDGVDTYGAHFTHVTYALLGKHEPAPCSACHQGATTVAALRDAPTECVACHATSDIHEGRLGTSCEQCHNPATWTDAKIDHDKTRFPLVGKHVGAVCLSCHVERHWTGIGVTCRACHAKDDPHDNQFPGDCASCHAATGWKDVTFDHAATRFKLVGGHAKPECAACHAGGRYVGTTTTCIGCHKADDEHKGKFGTDCAACHKVSDWSDVTFNHDLTGFKLAGAHNGPGCTACHAGGRFAGTPTTCIGCHRADDAHNGTLGTNCAACHRATTWGDVTFNHAKTAFPLTGAHHSVTCQRCHAGNVFAGTPTACSACHTKPASHAGAFGNGCASCHTTTAWRPSLWRGTHTFPKTHEGAGGVCSKCHPTVYATYSCARCHSNSSMTSHHQGVSGFSLTTCARCHPTGRED